MIRRTDDSPLPAALIIGPARGDDVLPAFRLSARTQASSRYPQPTPSRLLCQRGYCWWPLCWRLKWNQQKFRRPFLLGVVPNAVRKCYSEFPAIGRLIATGNEQQTKYGRRRATSAEWSRTQANPAWALKPLPAAVVDHSPSTRRRCSSGISSAMRVS
jgi:hypothetical protein